MFYLLWLRLRCRLVEWLRSRRLFGEGHAWWLVVTSEFPRRRSEQRLAALLLAARRTQWQPLRRYLARRLKPWLSGKYGYRWRESRVGMARYSGEFGGFDGRPVSATLVIKAPGQDGEKGVIYSSFEYNWVRLLSKPSAGALLDRYYLVGASSWSPPDYALFAWFAGLSTDPVVIGISNPSDVADYALMRPVIEPSPLMACDWIEPSFYEPKEHSQRSIDLLMVANWLPFKRHWLLFDALRRMDRKLRVVLVGRPGPGRSERRIREELRAFGVKQDVQLFSDIGIAEVTELQCDAKVSVLLSRREGSCVAVVESLFADTPVAMMRHAHVGSKAYINEATGILMSPWRMDRQLSRLLEMSSSLRPRDWMLAHGPTCRRSLQRLEDQLFHIAMAGGRPWTRPLVPFCWRPLPRYLREEDARAMEVATEELEREFGVRLLDGRKVALA
jgi:glycosyltransferase involved in cell wall biosynthesis